MFKEFDLKSFIEKNVTYRTNSLFQKDLKSFNNILHEKLSGRSILVIGAAGTIGSSFIRSVLKYPVDRLFAVDTNENGLTELVRDLRSTSGYNLPKILKTYPINFGSNVFSKIYEREGPFEIIANFAAHKHVRSEKDSYSIEAMIKNNVIEPKKFLDKLIPSPPEHFFCVSTDKAANPVNVMGASKKLMEDLILSYSSKIPITTARFANVAFSNGSLLSGFLERIVKRQPLSSPLDIKRYFLSPEESGELCMLACLLGNSGDIIFPKLNYDLDMVSFSDIGLKLLEELGYNPHICDSEDEARVFLSNTDSPSKYPIYLFKSDTSGEKSFEEFYTEYETLDNNSFSSLGIVKQQNFRKIEEISELVIALESIFKKSVVNNDMIISELASFIPTFKYINKGKNLDQRM
tara:strand:- start:861 stop:2078 length:1218 start_codon:yes stop_codon:yes gene_type:complete